MVSPAHRPERPERAARIGSELFERAAVICAVEELLASAQAGRPRCLVIDGPAGIGKTSVLDLATAAAEASGICTRRAVGDDLETGLPFGMARRLFADVEAAILTGTTALAGPVFAAAPEGAGGRDLFPLLHGLHALTVTLTEQAPQLFVLDDIQWSDPESLRFAAYLLNRLDGLRIGLLLATRTDSHAHDETAGLVARLRSSRWTSAHRLDGLGDDSVAELVRRRLPGASDAFCTAVSSATGGNPFLCEEMVSTIRAEGIPPTDIGAERLSTLHHAGIRTSILVRLGQLGHDAGAVAAATAVLGASATATRVAGLTRVDLCRVEDAVDRLVGAEILTTRGPQLDFVHPIIREAVYADIGPGRRTSSHREAGALLVAEAADPAEVATHVLAAEGAPDPHTIPALRQAAAAAVQQGAPRRAAELLRRALEAGPAPDVETRILVELGRAEAGCGHVAAIERFQAALAVLSGTEADAAVARDIGSALYGAGHYSDAARAFARGLDVLDAAPSRREDDVVEAQLVAGLDMASMLTGEQFDRLRAEQSPAPSPASPSLASRALACLAAGRHAFGVRLPPEQHRQAEALRHAEHALRGAPLPLELGTTVLEPLALTLYVTRTLGPALTLLDRLTREAADRGEMPAYTALVTVRGLVHLAAGDLRLAAADGAEAVALSAELPGVSGHVDAAARHVLGSSSLLLGDRPAAERAVDVDVAEAEDRWGGSVLYGWYLDAVGRVELDRGDAERALAAFEAAGASFLSSGGPAAFCPWRSGAALAAHALGDRTTALRLADEELRLAENFGTPGPIGAALRVRARLDGIEEAVPRLREAVRRLADGPRLERAHADVDLGAALRRAGRRTEARELLRRGHEDARRCGARPLAELAVAELGVAGARRPQMPVTGVDALTASERRVADLAVDGLTNREIAAALFISRKTVEVHLSACYRKLEIISRTELAGALG